MTSLVSGLTFLIFWLHSLQCLSASNHYSLPSFVQIDRTSLRMLSGLKRSRVSEDLLAILKSLSNIQQATLMLNNNDLMRHTDTHWHSLTLSDTLRYSLTFSDTLWHSLTLTDSQWHWISWSNIGFEDNGNENRKEKSLFLKRCAATLQRALKN